MWDAVSPPVARVLPYTLPSIQPDYFHIRPAAGIIYTDWLCIQCPSSSSHWFACCM